MESDPREAVQTPATALLVGGIALTLFYAFYCVWTGLGLALGCMSTGAQGVALAGGDEGAVVGVGMGLWGVLFSVFQIVLYGVLTAGGVYVVRAALAMKNLQQASSVRIAAIIAIAFPILGILLGSLLSMASLNCCGLVFGAIPQIVVFAVAAACGGFTLSSLSDEILDSFES